MESHHIPKQIIIYLKQNSLDIQNHGGGINLFKGQNGSEGPNTDVVITCATWDGQKQLYYHYCDIYLNTAPKSVSFLR
jgi:hypothetical protein